MNSDTCTRSKFHKKNQNPKDHEFCYFAQVPIVQNTSIIREFISEDAIPRRLLITKKINLATENTHKIYKIVDKAFIL